MFEIKKNDILYYARIIPTSGIYDVLELKIRTVADDWFVGIEKRDKQAFLFANENANKNVFKNRNDALKMVQDAEIKRKDINEEVSYEEY